MIEVTERAAKEVKRLLDTEGKPELGLRLAVEGGGCSGLKYRLGFDAKQEADNVMEEDGFKVFLDPKSTLYLKDIRLDYQDGLMGKGFIFTNPSATGTCGCGESFSV